MSLFDRDSNGQLWQIVINTDGTLTPTEIVGDIIPTSGSGQGDTVRTAQDIIKRALRLLGVIATGETPSNDEMQDGLTALNSMIDSWNTEGLMIPVSSRETFSITPSDNEYTMGSGGDFNTTRPVKIDSAAALIDGKEFPVEVLTEQKWRELQDKTSTREYPTALFYSSASPLSTVYLYPVPSASSTLVLYSRGQITRPATASTSMILAPGYDEALTYGLAIRLAPEYGKNASPEIVAIANNAKAAIKRNNLQSVELKVDPILRHRYYGYYNNNINSGYTY
jgi:hypothetical protein